MIMKKGVYMTKSKNLIHWAGITSAAFVSFGLLSTAQAQTTGTTLKVGGYIKLDVISSGYQDGDLPPGSLGRDFYVPGSTPIGGEDESRDIDFHAKTSRINFETTTQIEGQKVVGFFEVDFLTVDGNERVTNAYQPQLRHAYLTYDKWLFGQTWTTFQNVAALPESLDFIGPTEGTVFVRQAQVRYTRGPWQFSAENPETTVIPYNAGASIVTDDGLIPDLVARYNMSGDWGSLVIAGILRDLNYEDATADVDDHTTGYGLSVSGKFTIGSRDDLRFMVSAGSGLGRYVAINTINGAAVDADGNLEAIDLSSAMLSYRHLWNDKWRSNFILSSLAGDHDADIIDETAVTKATQSVHANLLYSPVAKITLGVEVMYAKRELENDADGTMNRIQFSAKYDL